MSGTITLYEATAALAAVEQLLIDADGVTDDALEAELAKVEGTFAEKVERVALKVQELGARAAAIESEAQRLTTRAKVARNAADSLRSYLHRQLTEAKRDKVPGLLVTVALQKSPPSIACENAQALHENGSAFVQRREAVSYHVDREAVLGLWKQGKPLPNGIAVEQSTHVRIR